MRLLRFSFLLLLLSMIFSVSASAQKQIVDIDESPNVSLRVLKWRLDQAAKELKTNSEKYVALLAFNQTGKPKSVAFQKLQQLRKYLIQKHHIQSGRIITKYAGTRNDGLVVEIRIFNQNPLESNLDD